MMRLLQPLREALRVLLQPSELTPQGRSAPPKVQALQVVAAMEVAPFFVSLLSELEEHAPHAVVLAHTTTFDSPAQYVGALLQQLQAELAQLNLGAVRALDALLPDIATTKERQPIELLFQTLMQLCELVAKVGGRALVCTIWPLEISAPQTYLLFLQQLLQQLPEQPFPAELRLIVRVLPSTPEHALTQPEYQDHARPPQPDLQPLHFDLSPARLQQCLEEAASDPAAPVLENLEALLTLAQLELAQHRALPAVEKFQQLLSMIEKHPHPPMQAVATCGLGQALLQLQLPEAALRCFKQAVTPAIASASGAILLQVIRNLAELSWQHAQEPETAQYHELWYRLSCQLEDAEGVALARHRLAELTVSTGQTCRTTTGSIAA
jgi:tetratricopeptide (TPR) repeat protein